MRATERLLEVIEEAAKKLSREVMHDLRAQVDNGPVRSHVSTVEKAARELRGRGDTLVRREDLRTVLRHVDPLGPDPALAPALERLDLALGAS